MFWQVAGTVSPVRLPHSAQTAETEHVEAWGQKAQQAKARMTTLVETGETIMFGWRGFRLEHQQIRHSFRRERLAYPAYGQWRSVAGLWQSGSLKHRWLRVILALRQGGSRRRLAGMQSGGCLDKAAEA